MVRSKMREILPMNKNESLMVRNKKGWVLTIKSKKFPMGRQNDEACSNHNKEMAFNG